MPIDAMDWSQSAPAGYVPAFRSGNANQFGHSHNANNPYMVRAEASAHDSRSQYGQSAGYHTHNAHLASAALHNGLHVPGSGLEDHFWSQQTDSSRDNLLGNGPPATRDEPIDDDPDVEADNTLDVDEEPDAEDAARPKRTKIPRSERRKNYKPRPGPSHPRLFRPFVPLEMEDTTPALWTLPPIVGTWLMFSNKLIKYRPMPPDIDVVREKLSKMEEPILLKNSQEVADYVPHITNVWRRAVQRVEIDPETGVQTEYWHCRTKKAMRSRNGENQGKGIRNRERKSQTLFIDQDVCKMRIRVTSFTKHADHNPFHIRVVGPRPTWNGHAKPREDDAIDEHERWAGGPCKCVAEWVHFELANVDPEITHHTHDLEVFDAYKRSEALQVLAKNKCEEGNSFSAVSKWMRKTYGETSKQVHKFEKGDTANAAQAWRKLTRDYVLRDEVTEDSEEMATMRRCVDAIVEADAPSLREALREVLKDSDALTKSALAILEKHKPDVPVQEPQEPWRLTEGASVMDLPSPGAPQRLKDNSGVYGPSRTPYPPLKQSRWDRRQAPPAPAPPAPVPAAQVPAAPAPPTPVPRPSPVLHPPFMGPDGRLIPMPGVLAPGTMATSQANVSAPQPQQYMHLQQQGPMPGNVQPGRGVPLQPRPPVPSYGPLPQVEVRYVHPPPQLGSAHPITISMEVPSCSLNNCKQCKHMRRELAGRRFFFQDSLHTPTHFQKLQDLLRDPKQLLDEKYTRSLKELQAPLWHPHPALGANPPRRPVPNNAPDLQRASVSTPNADPVQYTFLPPHTLPTPQTAVASSSNPARAQITNGANGAAQAQPQPAPGSIYDQPLPVPIVIEDDDDASKDENHDNADDEANSGEIDGGVNGDAADSAKNSGDDDAAADNDDDENDDENENEDEDEGGDEEEGEDEDEDEQRPAKRRRQGSAAED